MKDDTDKQSQLTAQIYGGEIDIAWNEADGWSVTGERWSEAARVTLKSVLDAGLLARHDRSHLPAADVAHDVLKSVFGSREVQLVSLYNAPDQLPKEARN